MKNLLKSLKMALKGEFLAVYMSLVSSSIKFINYWRDSLFVTAVLLNCSSKGNL